MKNFIILFLFSLLSILYACQEEAKQKENIQQIEETTKEIINTQKEEVKKEAIVPPLKVEVSKNEPDIIEVKEEKKLPPPPKTPTKVIDKIKEEQVKASPNKEKTCEDILEEYKTTVNKFLESNDVKYIQIISSWSNDVVFNQCKNDSELKAEFDKWEGIFNGDE